MRQSVPGELVFCLCAQVSDFRHFAAANLMPPAACAGSLLVGHRRRQGGVH